jgi:hypothetical protein
MSHKASEWVSERVSSPPHAEEAGTQQQAQTQQRVQQLPSRPTPATHLLPLSLRHHHTTLHHTTLHRTTLHCTALVKTGPKSTPNSSVPHDTKWQWRIWYWLYFCGTLRYWTLNEWNNCQQPCDATMWRALAMKYKIQKIWKQRIWVSRAGINLASSSCLWGF